jgi:Na+/melibiose symporter-like transporter
MENRIPLPTDNIFKFYAMFGLLLVIFGIGSILFVSRSTNDLVFEVAVEYETLKADPVRSVSQEARFQVLQKKLEIAISNKKFSIFGIALVIGVGIFMMGYGFKKWHTEVQPIQDEITRLSLKKLQREMGEDESA